MTIQTSTFRPFTTVVGEAAGDTMSQTVITAANTPSAGLAFVGNRNIAKLLTREAMVVRFNLTEPLSGLPVPLRDAPGRRPFVLKAKLELTSAVTPQVADGGPGTLRLGALFQDPNVATSLITTPWIFDDESFSTDTYFLSIEVPHVYPGFSDTDLILGVLENDVYLTSDGSINFTTSYPDANELLTFAEGFPANGGGVMTNLVAYLQTLINNPVFLDSYAQSVGFTIDAADLPFPVLAAERLSLFTSASGTESDYPLLTIEWDDNHINPCVEADANSFQVVSAESTSLQVVSATARQFAVVSAKAEIC